MIGKMLMASTLVAISVSLFSPSAGAQSGSDEPKVGEWFQKPFLRTEQLPPGFYYLFKSGEMLPTYYIKIPTETEKKRGEVPYIENRSQARKIDTQYKTDSYEPHLSFKSMTPEEEKKAAAAAANTSSEGDTGESTDSGATKAASSPTNRADPSKIKSPFKKNNYWSTFKSLPKSANQTLFGPTVKPNTKPFNFDEHKTHSFDQKKTQSNTTPDNDGSVESKQSTSAEQEEAAREQPEEAAAKQQPEEAVNEQPEEKPASKRPVPQHQKWSSGH